MPRTKKQADDFTDATPPPRRRPQGVPIGRYLVLPAGESAREQFLAWDQGGRVPEGSVLARFVGTGYGTGPNKSGYAVVVSAPGSGDPLGPPDSTIKPAAIEPWRVYSTVKVNGEPDWYVVLAPMKEKR